MTPQAGAGPSPSLPGPTASVLSPASLGQVCCQVHIHLHFAFSELLTFQSTSSPKHLGANGACVEYQSQSQRWDLAKATMLAL